MYSPAHAAGATPAKLGDANTTRVTVIGLGYVGLPLAVALAGRFETIGLDIDRRRIAELAGGHDRTGEITRERLEASELALLDQPERCPPSDFYIVTVPTPIDGANKPDLRMVESASRAIGAMLPAATAVSVASNAMTASADRGESGVGLRCTVGLPSSAQAPMAFAAATNSVPVDFIS